METPHCAPPRIALALPTGQQVLGERAGARERQGRVKENRLEREKSRILTAWEGEFGGCLLNRKVPPTPTRPIPTMGWMFIGQARGPSSARISPPRAKGTGLKREAKRGALPFDLQPQSSQAGCCPDPARMPRCTLPSEASPGSHLSSFKSKRSKVAWWEGPRCSGDRCGLVQMTIAAVTPAFWFSPQQTSIRKSS